MKKILPLITIAASALAFTQFAAAQDNAAEAPAAAKADKPTTVATEKTIADMWEAGGITMYPLGFMAVMGITLVIFNFIKIRKDKFLNPAGVKTVEKMLGALKIKDAVQFCEKNPSPITNIIGVGLTRTNDKEIDFESVEQAMEEASVEELAGPYVYINYLSLVASLSPMLGLYGTVSGMVKAFNTIAAEGAGSAQKLADNISEALITTAAGMIIGIPSMFFYFLFKNKYGTITSGTSRIIGDLVFTLKSAVKFGPQEIVELDEEKPSAE